MGDERIFAFAKRLRRTPSEVGEGCGGVSIVVGHSLFIRTIFQTFLSEHVEAPFVRVAASLSSQLLPYCGVVGTRFKWAQAGRARIVEAMPILGTQLAQADTILKDRPRSTVGGCMCGRGNTSCAIA